MTSRQLLVLLASHLAVLGLAYQLSRSGHAAGERDAGAPRAATKASDRANLGTNVDSDGPALLASFIEGFDRNPPLSAYESLKATLAVAADPEAAAIEAIRAYAVHEWPDKHDQESAERYAAEMEVRVLHWLRQSADPAKVLEFLSTDEDARKCELIYQVRDSAILDAASEQGVLKSWPWLIKTPAIRETIARAALKEMKSGGGLAQLARLESAMAEGAEPASLSSLFTYNLRAGSYAGPQSFFRSVGKATRFEERQALLDMVMAEQNPEARTSLVMGFASSSQEAARWLAEQQGLDPRLAAYATLEENVAGSSDAAQSYDQRIAALEQTGTQKDKDRQTILHDMVRDDLGKVLVSGRDWRYEFRHGVASLEEVVAATRAAMPEMPPEAEQALAVSLYRELAEENPAKALPLLDGLPEDQRRAALFDSSWQAMVNVNPDDFLKFAAALPEPVTATEKDLRTKGWNWKARGFLGRFGDDYIEWVKEMPEGIDKETAMNSLIWATREQNPAEARKLSEQLYPTKADDTK